MSKKAIFPPILVSSFATLNNLEKQQIAIHFESGDMKSVLVFSVRTAESLLEGLQKSLKRIKEREQ